MTGKSRMFGFIGPKWNPFGFQCEHGCVYCWAKPLSKRLKPKCPDCRQFRFHVHQERFNKSFKEGDFVFVEDVGDAYGDWVPVEWNLKMLDVERRNPKTKFLNLTKNPKRYLDLIASSAAMSQIFPENAILGATIESNRNYETLSKAPAQESRLYWMVQLAKFDSMRGRLFVSVEPVLEFDADKFELMLYWIKPWAIAIGMDNYGHKLPEPTLEKVKELIGKLGKFTTVYEKTLRPAWYEQT